MSEEMKTYEVVVVATTISVATVNVDAISEEDAVEITKTSVKPEDFEVSDVLVTHSVEAIERTEAT
jgi:hypothetical protein